MIFFNFLVYSCCFLNFGFASSTVDVSSVVDKLSIRSIPEGSQLVIEIDTPVFLEPDFGVSADYKKFCSDGYYLDVTVRVPSEQGQKYLLTLRDHIRLVRKRPKADESFGLWATTYERSPYVSNYPDFDLRVRFSREVSRAEGDFYIFDETDNQRFYKSVDTENIGALRKALKACNLDQGDTLEIDEQAL